MKELLVGIGFVAGVAENHVVNDANKLFTLFCHSADISRPAVRHRSKAGTMPKNVTSGTVRPLMLLQEILEQRVALRWYGPP